MATKTATVYVRLDPQVKARAEEILDALGIPVSSAINIFYKQIIQQNGLPFDVKLTRRLPLIVEDLQADELDAELAKGYDAVQSGQTQPAQEAFQEMNKKLGIMR